jgi:hypothetical protein
MRHAGLVEAGAREDSLRLGHATLVRMTIYIASASGI